MKDHHLILGKSLDRALFYSGDHGIEPLASTVVRLVSTRDGIVCDVSWRKQEAPLYYV